jgi:hypothetical protein
MGLLLKDPGIQKELGAAEAALDDYRDFDKKRRVSLDLRRPRFVIPTAPWHPDFQTRMNIQLDDMIGDVANRAALLFDVVEHLKKAVELMAEELSKTPKPASH